MRLNDASGLERGLEVARNTEEWDALWRRLVAGVLPTPGAPVRDFTTESVICVSLGERPSAGYDVSIERIVRHADRWSVHAREHRPAPGSIQAAVVTYPTALAAIDATSLPLELVWD